MTALEAVQEVLAGIGSPLNYREITRHILQQGLWHTSGKTPEATIRAQLGQDIKNRGTDSCFQHCSRGVFGLRTWGAAPVTPGGERDEGDQQLADTSALPPSTLSFADAVERVLDRFSGGSPMHYRAIMDKVTELGLVRTAGQTPERTLYTQVLADIDRYTRRGETPRFVRHGKGLIGLSRWQQPGLAHQIEQHNNRVRKQLHERLFTMPPTEFEALAARLLVVIGFEEVTVTSRSSDGGIDVRGTLVVGDVIRTRMAVQVKRWKTNVQAPTVQQVRGSLGTHEQGLIITTSSFSTGARAEAERPNAVPVALMNGEQFVSLLVEHSIGVQRTSHYLVELGEAEDE